MDEPYFIGLIPINGHSVLFPIFCYYKENANDHLLHETSISLLYIIMIKLILFIVRNLEKALGKNIKRTCHNFYHWEMVMNILPNFFYRCVCLQNWDHSYRWIYLLIQYLIQ